jgi:hypothetical protein
MYWRAILVLIFAVAAVLLLMMFPGPLFSSTAHPELNLTHTSGDFAPLDPDGPQRIKLREKEESAMNTLLAMRPQR